MSKSVLSWRDRSLKTRAVWRTSRVPRFWSSWGGATDSPTLAVGDSEWPSSRAASLSRCMGAVNARATNQAASATAMILITASRPIEIHGGWRGPGVGGQLLPGGGAGTGVVLDSSGWMDCRIGGVSRHGGGGAVARKTSNARNELVENATSSSRKMRTNSVSRVLNIKVAPASSSGWRAARRRPRRRRRR